MTQNRSGWCWQLRLASSLAIGGAIIFSGDCTFAQITPDGTLPNNSRVTTEGNTSIITEGTQAGSNLFHSFEQFSIPTNGKAFFDNAADIQNIFSRVTGSSISDIDGLIRAKGSANLFLLNPNGMVFGPNARLNISGSFVGSTASSLNFADGTQFSATTPQTTPLLTISVPLGLQFGESPGRILVQGNGLGRRKTSDLIDTPFGLRVQPNQTLALVGGDVAIEGGTLKTAGGRIELGSVAGSSLVSLKPIDFGWVLSYEGVSSFGDIQLSQQAAVDASGAGGGDIQVQGRQVTLRDGSQIEASTLTSEPGRQGTLTVRASELVELMGTSTALGTLVYKGATGAGGDVILKTRRLSIQDGAQVLAGTFGPGKGGNLVVSASESVELSGGSGLFTQTQGAGDAGDLTINTEQLLVQEGAVVSAATFGQGKGGNLRINATSINISGVSPGGLSSGLFVRSGESGNAGNIEVKTRSLRLDNQAKITAETASGTGGNIALQVEDLLLMQNDSLISAQAKGDANGGNIDIDAGLVVASPNENSDIIANADQGQGGDIDITTQGIFGLEERSSTPRNQTNDIDASSQFGVDGTVEINTLDVEPTRLVNLPTRPLDTQVAQTCSPSQADNEFYITGRGGMPPTIQEIFGTEAVLIDWVSLNPEAAEQVEEQVEEQERVGERENFTPSERSDSSSNPDQIVEAQGWIIGPDGEVILTAQPPNVTPHSSWQNPANCHDS